MRSVCSSWRTPSLKSTCLVIFFGQVGSDQTGGTGSLIDLRAERAEGSRTERRFMVASCAGQGEAFPISERGGSDSLYKVTACRTPTRTFFHTSKPRLSALPMRNAATQVANLLALVALGPLNQSFLIFSQNC